MKLVVGLGNPGRKYDGTRHNAGFMVLDQLARRAGEPRAVRAFQGETVAAIVDSQRVLLLWPHTFMNRSGASVLAARDFHKLQTEDVLIICDDFNLPLTKLRFRAKGSAGGQKGLADIIRVLGTDEISRLRVGIGDIPERWDPADFVLSKFTRQEQPLVEDVVSRAADAAETWVRHGLQFCMNKYN